MRLVARQVLFVLLVAVAALLGTVSASASVAGYSYDDTPHHGHDGYDHVVNLARGGVEGNAAEAHGLWLLHRAIGGSLAPSGVFSAPEATRTVTIGRNMGERVIPYAERHGYDLYRGTPRWVPRNLIERVSPRTLERIDLWFNRRWIRGEMGQGSRIVDIGEPPGYPPSRFYDMELDEVSGYCNYCRDPQP